MASAETTQTPAIMAVLPAISVNAERGMISSTTRMVERRQRQDGDAGEQARHTTVVADFGGRFLGFEVHGGQSYAGRARPPPGPGGNR